eukprot:Em0004g1a
MSLVVQIIEICLATRDRNGGLMSFDELRKRVLATSGKTRQGCQDDLARAIKKLHLLGSGFAVITAGSHRLVQSVPGELSMDHSTVFQKAEATSYTSLEILMKDLGWTEQRARATLDHLVAEGMAWVDQQDNSGTVLYWFPGLFSDGS